MNLKIPGVILPLGCAILSTRAKTVRGVGTAPLRRTRVNVLFGFVLFCFFRNWQIIHSVMCCFTGETLPATTNQQTK